jgi:cytochrome c oxidase subunit 2
MYATIFWVSVVIAIAVFGVMIYSVATFPAAPHAGPVKYRRNLLVEIVWALIPIAIMVSAAWPAAKMIHAQDLKIAAAAK